MDSRLQKVIQDSSVLTEELRERLRSGGEDLTSAQVDQVLKLIENAEVEYGQIQSDLDVRKRAINEDYLKKVDDFFKHGVPRAMKKAEEVDRSKEEADLDNILIDLDNI